MVEILTIGAIQVASFPFLYHIDSWHIVSASVAGINLVFEAML